MAAQDEQLSDFNEPSLIDVAGDTNVDLSGYQSTASGFSFPQQSSSEYDGYSFHASDQLSAPSQYGPSHQGNFSKHLPNHQTYPQHQEVTTPLYGEIVPRGVSILNEPCGSDGIKTLPAHYIHELSQLATHLPETPNNLAVPGSHSIRRVPSINAIGQEDSASRRPEKRPAEASAAPELSYTRRRTGPLGTRQADLDGNDQIMLTAWVQKERRLPNKKELDAIVILIRKPIDTLCTFISNQLEQLQIQATISTAPAAAEESSTDYATNAPDHIAAPPNLSDTEQRIKDLLEFLWKRPCTPDPNGSTTAAVSAKDKILKCARCNWSWDPERWFDWRRHFLEYRPEEVFFCDGTAPQCRKKVHTRVENFRKHLSSRYHSMTPAEITNAVDERKYSVQAFCARIGIKLPAFYTRCGLFKGGEPCEFTSESWDKLYKHMRHEPHIVTQDDPTGLPINFGPDSDDHTGASGGGSGHLQFNAAVKGSESSFDYPGLSYGGLDAGYPYSVFSSALLLSDRPELHRRVDAPLHKIFGSICLDQEGRKCLSRENDLPWEEAQCLLLLNLLETYRSQLEPAQFDSTLRTVVQKLSHSLRAASFTWQNRILPVLESSQSYSLSFWRWINQEPLDEPWDCEHPITHHEIRKWLREASGRTQGSYNAGAETDAQGLPPRIIITGKAQAPDLLLIKWPDQIPLLSIAKRLLARAAIVREPASSEADSGCEPREVAQV